MPPKAESSTSDGRPPAETGTDARGDEDDGLESLGDRRDLRAGLGVPMDDGKESAPVEVKGTTATPFEVQNMMAILNGDYYMPNDMGEAETVNAQYNWVFPAGFKGSGAAGRYDARFTTEAMMKSFIALNFRKLKSLNIADGLAAKITMWRAIAVKQGLVNCHDTPAITNTKYVEIEYAEAGDSKGYSEYLAGMNSLTQRVKDNVGSSFADVVCTIAFVFRVRGHHYIDDLKDVYSRIWRKLRGMPEGMVGEAEWETIATIGLHGITPLRLDEFWINSAENGRIGNPLIIRLSAPAAGTAAWFAIYAGIANLQALIPHGSTRFDAQIRIVQDAVNSFKAHRWNGSINRRLYGARESSFNLMAVAELAAAVKGSVEPADLESELKNAASLNKVIGNAPLVRATFRAFAEGLITATNQTAVREKLGRQLFDFVGFKEPAGDVSGQ